MPVTSFVCWVFSVGQKLGNVEVAVSSECVSFISNPIASAHGSKNLLYRRVFGTIRSVKDSVSLSRVVGSLI